MSDTYSAAREIGPKDAQLVAETFGEITKEKGRISTREMAEQLLAKSRAKSSATHHLFEWDDRKAAEKQRLDHAMRIVSSIYVVFEEQPEAPPIRAFPVLTHKGVTGPVPMRKVLESRDLSSALLEEALRDIAQFKRRYEGLRELADVFAAMDRVAEKKRKAG